jgi:hypothetical protein
VKACHLTEANNSNVIDDIESLKAVKFHPSCIFLPQLVYGMVRASWCVVIFLSQLIEREVCI